MSQGVGVHHWDFPHFYTQPNNSGAGYITVLILINAHETSRLIFFSKDKSKKK